MNVNSNQGFSAGGWLSFFLSALSALVLIATGFYLTVLDSSASSDVTGWLTFIVWIVALVLTVNTLISLIALKHTHLKRSVEVLDRLTMGEYTTRLDQSENDPLSKAINQLATQLEHNMQVSGLHGASMTACATQLMAIKDMVLSDSHRSHDIVQTVDGAINGLGETISQVKNDIGQATEDMEILHASAIFVTEKISTIASASEQASANITAVASAAEEITANMGGVNAHLEEVNTSVNNVADSIESMNTSLSDVQTLCEAASQESDRANRHAKGTYSVMDALTQSTIDIGKLLILIDDISEQTHLLSLNASIEAAGAGEYGLGFAVVASEINDLSQQTAAAVETISNKIGEIQSNSTRVTEVATLIATSIDKINETNQEITLEMSQQSLTVKEVSDAMTNVVRASAEVTRNNQEVRTAAEDVARSMLEAAEGTTEVARATAESVMAAQEDVSLAEETKAFVEKLLFSIEKTDDSARLIREKMHQASQVVDQAQGTARHFQRLESVLRRINDTTFAHQMEFNYNTLRFNVRKFKEYHLELQGKLEQTIQGRLAVDCASMENHEPCGLRKWAERIGPELAETPQFQQMISVHDTLHEVAITCQKAIEADNKEHAIEQSDLYNSLRNTLFDLLDQTCLRHIKKESRPVIEWRDTLSVHVNSLDNDHKQLIKMINDLHSAMKNGYNRKELGTVIQSFQDHCNNHFEREEQLMKRHRFPLYEEHKEEHDSLMKTLDSIKSQFDSGYFAVAIDALSFSRLWLNQHILESDMKYRDYFIEKGIVT
ncbi:MAG: bacteriohemerythrin [Magnetococcales bacterium]|nr:bacteriohemerythrin [Magnetococcales bacterium]